MTSIVADYIPRESDAAARGSVISSFQRIAEYLTRRYRHWSLDPADLVQGAMVAAIAAIDSYVPACGGSFAGYVIERMGWAMRDEVMRARRQTRFSRSLRADPADGSWLEQDEDHEALWDAIEELPARDRAILVGVYGLDGRLPMRRADFAKRGLGCQSQVSESTTRSMKALRCALG